MQSQQVAKNASIWIFALVVFSILMLSACSQQPDQVPGEPDTPIPAEPSQDFIGPIPIEEFNEVPPPSFDQLISAINNVYSRNPNIVQDEDAFTRAIFDEIRASQAIDATNLYDDGKKLTFEEWVFSITHPNQTRYAYPAKASADQIGAEAGFSPCEGEDGRGDAIRHASWNALMAYNVYTSDPAPLSPYSLQDALNYAEGFATAHESEAADVRAKAMDLSNNAAGRRVFRENSNSSPAQLITLIKALPMEFVSQDEEVTFDDSRLVFITKTPACGDYKAQNTITITGEVSEVYYVRIFVASRQYRMTISQTPDGFNNSLYIDCTYTSDSILSCIMPPRDLPSGEPYPGLTWTGKADGKIWSGDLTSEYRGQVVPIEATFFMEKYSQQFPD